MTNLGMLVCVCCFITLNSRICLITRRRIECELYYMKEHKPKNVLDVSIHNDHVWEWKVTILGHKGTPYEGGYFHQGIRFMPDHPRSPPIVVFVTRVHHPNIALNVGSVMRGLFICVQGEVSMQTLQREWGPTT